MEMSRIKQRGQITLPLSVRQKLHVQEGHKVVFVEENGRIYVENAGMRALEKAQEMMEGAAEELNLKDIDDVVALIKDVRREKRESLNALGY
ncbi:AbrB family transcriptional regulator [Clostridia bacterium]|nr:AbrB family transcriptional regulator [Clostridia bacterium]